jgi:uncharacterized protein (TIGR01777 family)
VSDYSGVQNSGRIEPFRSQGRNMATSLTCFEPDNEQIPVLHSPLTRACYSATSTWVQCSRMSRILISGASGLIGGALIPALENRGDQVYRLVRREPCSEREVRWNPTEPVPPALLAGCDAVVHLSGESVAGRWSEDKKKSIRDSRVITTRNLATALAHTRNPPQAFLCASAIGYYGNRGDEVLTERSPAGHGFLAEVSSEWEQATQPAVEAGIRVVNLRIGIVLSMAGGAFKQMLRPFRFGLGGKIGDGQQWFCWIHVDDLVGAALEILDPASRRAEGPIRGPVNMVSPNPVKNAEFTNTLGRVLGRPAVFSVPAFMLRLAWGEFADEGPLSSARVVPGTLASAGFEFKYPRLEPALIELLGR